jgi:hypothetical protein
MNIMNPSTLVVGSNSDWESHMKRKDPSISQGNTGLFMADTRPRFPTYAPNVLNKLSTLSEE